MKTKPAVDDRELRTFQHRSAAQKARVDREQQDRECLRCGVKTSGLLCQTCFDARYGGPLYKEDA